MRKILYWTTCILILVFSLAMITLIFYSGLKLQHVWLKMLGEVFGVESLWGSYLINIIISIIIIILVVMIFLVCKNIIEMHKNH